MRRFVTFLGAIGCVLLVVGGCARTVSAPAAESEVGTLAAYVVTNGEDAGPGSLRQVVADAPVGVMVTFDASVTTVSLISAPITIDKNLTIAGPEGGTVTVSGSDTTSVFFVAKGGVRAVLRNLTITHGRSAGEGGGVAVEYPGTAGYSSLALYDCTVAENTAATYGGGLDVQGGLWMERTTVRDNVALNGRGGGVHFQGSASYEPVASVTIRNSTFTGNRAAEGGGFANSGGAAKIEFSTFTGNLAGYAFGPSAFGGGLYSYNHVGTQTTLVGTIIVGNVTLFDAAPNDVFAGYAVSPFVSRGYNLIGVGSGSADVAADFDAIGDVTGLTDAGLLALDDNGGPTLTHALGSGSPAIDAAACMDASGAALAVDQRGMARPQGTRCDIGAFELERSGGLVVTNGDDDGVGSLRQVVAEAPAGATVTFDAGVADVALTSGSLVIDKDLTIAGPEDGTVTLRGNGAASVVRVPVAGVDLVLRNLTITGGSDLNGGGVIVLWPTPWDDPPPSLSLVRCTVADNYAANKGGGVYVEGNLYVDATTVRGNTSGFTSIGGGIAYNGTDVDGDHPYPVVGTIINSTITGNGADYGGGVGTYNGALLILFSTITANTAQSEGGGIYSWNDALTRTSLKGSIVVGNASPIGADDVFGNAGVNRFDSHGHNVIGAGGGSVDFTLEFTAVGDLTGVADAGLVALADNGGPTPTHALAPGSIGLDHVPSTDCTDLYGAALTGDQRGVPRPQGVNCDSGAFELAGGATTYFLYVTVAPVASGTVAGGGTYQPGATATLIPTPADHWQFSHWSGDLTGSDDPASFTMDAGKSVVANFTHVLYPVNVTLDGGGSVLHDPAGPTYAYGTWVTVTAVPTDDWGFASWSGALQGPFSPGFLQVTGPMAYTAHFVRWYPLTLQVVGSGAVAANPPQETYLDGTVVTLTATPETGWRFAEWGGDLTGSTNPATVTMDAAKSVTAVFQRVLGPTLTVTLDGTGHVTSVPEGIDCWPTGGTCVASFRKNTTVTLRATPEAGATFAGWTGAVTGMATDVTLRMNADKATVAHFIDLNGPHVVISPTGSFRGSTAVANGSLMCASGSHDLDVSVAQSVRVSKTVDQLVTASTTVLGVACGQPWTATLVAEFGRFARGAATVTVTIEGIPTTATVQLR